MSSLLRGGAERPKLNTDGKGRPLTTILSERGQCAYPFAQPSHEGPRAAKIEKAGCRFTWRMSVADRLIRVIGLPPSPIGLRTHEQRRNSTAASTTGRDQACPVDSRLM
eukprot:122920-Rhodomonas_salina.3